MIYPPIDYADDQVRDRDGQHDPEVDVEDLVGDETTPDHDLDPTAFQEVDD